MLTLELLQRMINKHNFTAIIDSTSVDNFKFNYVVMTVVLNVLIVMVGFSNSSQSVWLGLYYCYWYCGAIGVSREPPAGFKTGTVSKLMAQFKVYDIASLIYYISHF